MLQVFLDDSGKDGKSPAFVLAGYIAHVHDWDSFANDWQTLLAKERSIKYIKGYEAFRLKKQFDKWSELDRDRRMLEFIALIKSYSGKGIAFTIERQCFTKILDGVPKKPFDSPSMFAYLLALTSILPIVADLFDSQQIDLILDHNVVKRPQAKSAYKQLGMVAPELFQLLARKEPRFEDDMNVLPLQAADILAFCIKAHTDQSGRYEQVRESPIFSELRSIPTLLIQVGENEMQYFKNRVLIPGTPRKSFRGIRW